MGNFRTISNLLRGTWAIDRDYADNQLPLVAAMLNGGVQIGRGTAGDNTTIQREIPEKYSYNRDDNTQIVAVNTFTPSYWSGFKDAPKGSIAVLPVRGALMKEDNCGSAGMLTTVMRIEEANESQNITAIILRIDSPGGSVDGTSLLADAVKKSKKPVIAWIEDGMAASAAYWVASSAAEIYSSHATNIVGSIGVYTTFMDYAPALEKLGVKVHSIYAPQSTQKNIEARSLKGDNPDPKPMEKKLAVIADAFITAVMENRAGKIAVAADHDVFKGATFFAEEAVKLGLIDGIASFADVVGRASALADGAKSGGLYV